MNKQSFARAREVALRRDQTATRLALAAVSVAMIAFGIREFARRNK